jgi:hypothetical protein
MTTENLTAELKQNLEKVASTIRGLNQGTYDHSNPPPTVKRC